MVYIQMHKWITNYDIQIAFVIALIPIFFFKPLCSTYYKYKRRCWESIHCHLVIMDFSILSLMQEIFFIHFYTLWPINILSILENWGQIMCKYVISIFQEKNCWRKLKIPWILPGLWCRGSTLKKSLNNKKFLLKTLK